MNYADFVEKNFTYTAPEGDKDCGDLPVYKMDDPKNPNTKIIFSCWEITPDEILEVLMTKRIWLQVHFPEQPPVALFARSPFRAPEPDGEAKARLENFKSRLVKHFIAEEFGAAQQDINVPMVEEMMTNFLNFLMKRGE